VFESVPEMDFHSLCKFAVERGVELAVVGPEIPLVSGIRRHFDRGRFAMGFVICFVIFDMSFLISGVDIWCGYRVGWVVLVMGYLLISYSTIF
jgi:hypothetical protein